MVGVITGDIINSRKEFSYEWLDTLKDELNNYGSTPKDWDIYRGDAFQLIVEDSSEVLLIAIKTKAAIKQIPKLDLRMSIGIGQIEYKADSVTESNGTAFVYSGETIERLKKEKRNLAIKSNWPSFDTEMNLYLKLGLIAMDNWTPLSAETIKIALDQPSISQKEIGDRQEIKQSTVSRRLKRAYYEEILELNEIFKQKLAQLQ